MESEKLYKQISEDFKSMFGEFTKLTVTGLIDVQIELQKIKAKLDVLEKIIIDEHNVDDDTEEDTGEEIPLRKQEDESA